MPYKNKEDKLQWQRDNWKNIYKDKPWVYTIRAIRSRCCGKTHHYHSKGIQNFLSTSDVKMMWFRDRAYEMERPSIDRIDSKKDYTLGNCRFLELSENMKRRFYGNS